MLCLFVVEILFIFFYLFFFFNDTATTEIYTLSLHDALPILGITRGTAYRLCLCRQPRSPRSEEHTSELQSPTNLVCRLLLEKKKKRKIKCKKGRKKNKKMLAKKTVKKR